MPDDSLKVPAATKLYALSRVAQILGVSRPSVKMVIRAQIAGPAFETDNDQLIGQDALDKLVTWSQRKADISVPAFNLRIAEAFYDKIGDTWYGYHAGMPKEQLDSIFSGPYQYDNPEELVGRAFVATVGGFVVFTANISGFSRTLGRCTLEFEEPTKEQSEAYVGRKLTSPGGAQVVHLGR